ncbi:MAG TPA: hypothetical protein VF172_09000 [Nitrososphaera sp.]|jgi:hypothetical protein
MFKVIALIVAGTFLMAFGLHFLLNSGIVFQLIQLPSINWAIIGVVVLVGGAAVFGSAFVVSKLSE